MKISTARTLTRIMINEPNAYFFTDSDLNSFVEEAQYDICTKTLCMQKFCTAFNTTTTCANYSVPTSVNASSVKTIGVRAILDSNTQSLNYISQDLIGRTGADENLMRWTIWAEQIIITPLPTASKSLTPLIWIMDAITAENTEFPLPNAYHSLIPLYCVYKAYQKRRTFAAAEAAYKHYKDEINDINNIFTKFYQIPEKTTIKDQSPVD